MDKERWCRLLHRQSDTSKYDYGHVLILGGSEAMTGAPVLAGRAALRTGAGLVTIASTNETIELIDRDIEEIMTLSLPSWHEVEELVDIFEMFIRKRQVSVLVIGPGLPAAANEIIRALLLRVRLPMILDAEVFSALSGHLSVLHTAVSPSIILTPHPGEYARLIKNEPQYNANNEHSALKRFTKDYGVTLVLKHSRTLIVSPEDGIYENTTGNPGLATAGAGDVLAGIMASLLAQEIEPYEAAKMAVYLHGLAGDMAAESNTEPGMIASDVIEFLPKALKDLEHLTEQGN